jgi:hypothetical protein
MGFLANVEYQWLVGLNKIKIQIAIWNLINKDGSELNTHTKNLLCIG